MTPMSTPVCRRSVAVICNVRNSRLHGREGKAAKNGMAVPDNTPEKRERLTPNCSPGRGPLRRHFGTLFRRHRHPPAIAPAAPSADDPVAGGQALRRPAGTPSPWSQQGLDLHEISGAARPLLYFRSDYQPITLSRPSAFAAVGEVHSVVPGGFYGTVIGLFPKRYPKTGLLSAAARSWWRSGSEWIACADRKKGFIS